MEVAEVEAPVEPIEASVEAWAKASLQTKRGGSIRCTEAREIYERSVRAAGGAPRSPNAFGRAMSALGYRREKKGGHFHYCGVALVQAGLKVVGG